ncbi:hypothetical protein [Thermophilibacter sp.]
MDKNAANSLLASLWKNGALDEIREVLTEANTVTDKYTSALQMHFDAALWTRMYADIARASLVVTISRHDWSRFDYSPVVVSRGPYPRVELQGQDSKILLWSPGGKVAKYIKDAMALNDASGSGGQRSVFLECDYDERKRISTARLVIRNGKKAELAAVTVFPTTGDLSIRMG